MIVEPPNRKLVVLDYLESRGRSDLQELFTYGDPATDLRIFAESTIADAQASSDNGLKPIVEGKTFEETPIDGKDTSSLLFILGVLVVGRGPA